MGNIENAESFNEFDDDDDQMELEYEDVIILRLLVETFRLKETFTRLPDYTRRKFRHLDAFETSANVLLAEMGYFNG